MATGQANEAFGDSFRLAVDGGLPAWPCTTCKTVSWRKQNGQTVCGNCQDYGERLRMARELEQNR